MQKANAALLHEQIARSAPARRVSAPSTACLMCGIASVLVSALDLARGVQVWWESGTGHLCPACSAAVEHVGALGPTAIERALILHLTGTAPSGWGDVSLDGLVGWVALSTARPNSSPWEHVAGLDEIRESR